MIPVGYMAKRVAKRPDWLNSIAEELPTNVHCLFASFDEAQIAIEKGAFKDCEPGPYRILSVYSTDWP